MSEASDLPAECARALGLAVLAAVRMLGGEALLLDEDDDFAPGPVKLARVGDLAFVERPGDRMQSRPRRFTGYRIAEVEPGTPFKLDPDRALFILHETGFYAPPDWRLKLLVDPRDWYNDVMLALYAALEPVLPAA